MTNFFYLCYAEHSFINQGAKKTYKKRAIFNSSNETKIAFLNIMRKRILTGDRPTGKLHLGHYMGSLLNRVKLQKEGMECFFIIADYQVLTDRLDTKDIEQSIFELLLDYLSVGIDPRESVIFIQSRVPEIAELFVYLSMLVTVSRAERNPTVKEEVKSANLGKQMSVGMLSYPISQAADILLFRPDLVPVGEDQLPHLEQTREIARTFNRVFGKVFPIPEAILSKTPRLLGLDGRQKMSKSRGNAIYLSDPTEVVTHKIKKAVTDSGKEIIFNPYNKPAISNLLTIFSFCSGRSIKALEKTYQGEGYNKFKSDLIQVVNDFLTPFRKKRKEFTANPEFLEKILREGTNKAREEGEKTMKLVRKAMKFHYPKIFGSAIPVKKVRHE